MSQSHQRRGAIELTRPLRRELGHLFMRHYITSGRDDHSDQCIVKRPFYAVKVIRKRGERGQDA